jgi:hypothetical protein
MSGRRLGFCPARNDPKEPTTIMRLSTGSPPSILDLAELAAEQLGRSRRLSGGQESR